MSEEISAERLFLGPGEQTHLRKIPGSHREPVVASLLTSFGAEPVILFSTVFHPRALNSPAGPLHVFVSEHLHPDAAQALFDKWLADHPGVLSPWTH